MRKMIGERGLFLALLLLSLYLEGACAANPLERFAPNFSTNTAILWQAPSNCLPSSLWIYKRLPPQPFLPSVVSNALAMASLQPKEIPEHFTNNYYIRTPFDCCGMAQNFFGILPAKTQIYFSATNQSLSTDDLPDDATVKKRAFYYSALLGLGNTRLIPQDIFCSSNAYRIEAKSTNGACGKGIFLSRELDGIPFYSSAGIDEADGFSIEFGSHGQIRAFSLVWPNLERSQNCRIAKPQQIINLLRARRILVVPNTEEEKYFERLKILSKARTLFITGVIPRYGEIGAFGEASTSDASPEFLIPFAEIYATASWGNSNAAMHFISPILSSEITRLVENN